MSSTKKSVKTGQKAAAAAGVGSGPLAAWRLTLAVACAGMLTGRGLLAAATTGEHLDLALGRSFAAACLVWLAAGRINRMFVDVERKRVDELVRLRDSMDDAIDVDGSGRDESAFS